MARLKKGQVVTATVEEQVNSTDYIVSYDGHLIRVCNRTGRAWKKHQSVPLVVSGLNPLSFQLNENHIRRHLRVSV